MSDNRYMMRGVSAAKEDVHNWPICTGKRLVTFLSGKVLLKMPLS